MSLDIDQFSPKKTELMDSVEKYKNLKIDGIEDKTGYSIVDEARKDLKRKRVEIQKTGKELRSEAVQFQKAVIALEKDLVTIIEPLELELKSKQNEIDEEKLKIVRRELLPERMKQLTEIGVDINEEFLLLMDDAKYHLYYNEKKTLYLEEKERKLKEDEEKLKRERELEEVKKQAAEQARKDAEEKAEKEKQAAVEAERQKTEALEREKQEKLDAEEAEKQEQKKIEKRKKYKEFLAEHDYQDTEEFHLVKTDESMILYKKIGEFNYN